NAAAFLRFYWRAEQRRVINLLMPTLGFLVCVILWWNLSTQARVIGGIWMAVGIALGVWKTRASGTSVVSFDLPPDVTPETSKA
ncbi:MAG TPA: hypothetical protein VII41_00120, partial [Steroidobacteraceae bacterium]